MSLSFSLHRLLPSSLSSLFRSSNNLITSSSTNHQIRCATKKAGGSSNNGRDSAGRRLGVKIFPGSKCKAGSILVRQRGRKFHAGDNVGMGKDHTIWAKIPGTVRYTRNPKNKKRNIVHVIAAAAPEQETVQQQQQTM